LQTKEAAKLAAKRGKKLALEDILLLVREFARAALINRVR
jgi:hypothetical protein